MTKTVCRLNFYILTYLADWPNGLTTFATKIQLVESSHHYATNDIAKQNRRLHKRSHLQVQTVAGLTTTCIDDCSIKSFQ